MENKNVATFVKVVELNNFTKAAQSLGYSQAAVTAQIKQLERELGSQLFDRLGKRIRLTRAGETFLPYAVKLLKAENEAISCIKDQKELSGTLTVGTTSSLAMGALPQVGINFIKEHPEVNLVVKISDFIEDLVNKLNSGEVDLVFNMAKPIERKNEQILMEKRVEMSFVTSAEGKLAGKQVRLEELLKEPLIVTDRGVGYTLHLEQIAAMKGFKINPVIEIGSVAAIIDVLRSGFGVSYLPDFVICNSIERGELKNIDVIDVPNPQLISYMYCNKSKWIDPLMQTFIEYANAFII